MIRALPRSTSGLVVLVAIVLAVTTILLGFVVYTVSHEALEQQLDHRIAVETKGLLTLHSQGGLDALAAGIAQREAAARGDGMGYILDDAQGRRLAGALRARTPQPGWLEFLHSEQPNGEQRTSQALTTVLPEGARLVVAADRAPIGEIDLAILGVFAAAFSLMLIAGVGSAWLLGSVTRRRLARINAAAEAIIDGDLARRVPRDPTSNEFDDMAATLNRMLDRNEALLENLQQVSSDIAHDMRTPLARLRNVLDAALRQDLDAEQARNALTRASNHAEDLLDLFAALLRISEIETFQIRTAFQATNLSEVAERCIDALRPDVEADGYRMVADIAPGVMLDGDKHLLSQLIVNLIENAARHTPPGSTITVSLGATASHALLSIADDGPGIPPDKHAFVLRRFSRLEQSRNTPGNGLGLSLAAAVARAHFSELRLQDRAPGLEASLSIPLRAPIRQRSGD
ncbi:HAMP domain-containing sensor histidine kinase [Caulobacter sp. RHG1]|uniref:HAMP domain-containing sensor histidine kinase n=1 Tax=Caulobacter sp. (strain RHG1) TaxID=2545762 RepID=UPI0015548931|nr:HAMP domain-containing sensor histidine kinase [Caulobacter sp. RHG1]NQE63731.1 hypothetical protein [Caulobacter sp. RHG1]